MLDRLLGRAELKERIDDLEAEKEHLARQVESAKESRAEAVTARQRAEEEVNRLEDRVAELEDRVERLQGDEPDLTYRAVEAARGRRRDELVSRLQGIETAEEGALTAYVADDDAVPDEVRDLLGDHASLVARAAPCLVCADDGGLVSVALSLPVPPEPFVEWGEGFRVEDGWVRPTGRVCLALVRADLFACGVYDDGERVAYEGFESDVKGDHSKGGFSQARFERRRDAQIDEHLEDARAAVEEHAADVDRVVVAGEETALSEFRDLAEATVAVDATGEPESALADAFEDVWTVRVYGI